MDRRRFLALAGGMLALPRPVRAWPAVAPLRRLRLVNAHTRETFDGPFRDDIGPIAVALAELSEFLRDHYSGEKTVIDVGVLDFLAGVMDATGRRVQPYSRPTARVRPMRCWRVPTSGSLK